MGLFGGGNSTQSTTNLSQTQTQDRRTVADGGSAVVNADGSTVTLISNQSDAGAINAATSMAAWANQTAQAGLGVADRGMAYGAQTAQASSLWGQQTAQYALGTMGNAVTDLAAASNHLNDVGLSMLQANTALTNSMTSKTLDTGASMLANNTSLAASLTNGTNNLVTHLMDTAGGLFRDAATNQSQTTQIAADLAKTQVAAQNDNRYLIAVGLVVVAIVGVMAFKGKA